MAKNERNDSTAETGVALGFLEEAEDWELQSPQFPSKVGGKPAWLSLAEVPGLPDLACGVCRLPTAFLLQVYAPIAGQERSFHRTVFVFCCRTPTCFSPNDSGCLKVYRSQLPRRNDFYPYDPPSEERPGGAGWDPRVLGPAGGRLCQLCGCPGQKSCSRCHSVFYCSKEHQVADWKHRHKTACCSQGPPSEVVPSPSPFLFPESELVTEPEEQQEEPYGGAAEEQHHIDPSSLADALEETELEEMATQETQDSKVFQRFKQRISSEPHQVLRYCRGGSPLWVSSEHVPTDRNIPPCPCGSKRTFEFQVMPQLLNHLSVDSSEASIDWGTLAIYTCADSCNQGNNYSAEFIWKQDVSGKGV